MVGLLLRIRVFIPTTAIDSHIAVTSPAVSNWNYENNKYLKNHNKSNSKVINLQKPTNGRLF
jgi:hypothetical protein